MKHAKLLILFVLLLALAGAAQAKLTLMFDNSDFEKGNYTNWTATGAAFGIAPALGALVGNAPQGTYSGSSANWATILESTQGTLTSAPFTVPTGFDIATFYMAGWGDDNQRVDFKQASDNTVLISYRLAANNPAFTQVSVTGFAALAGKQIYIEVVDAGLAADPSGPNGWVAVDNFCWDDGQPLPANANLIFANSNFETGDLTNWTITEGDVWQTASDLMPWVAQAPEGKYVASTFFMGGGTAVPENSQSTLRSINFTVPAGKDGISFYIAGWADPNIKVEFHKASDDGLIASKQVPATSAALTQVTVKGFSAYTGQQIYILAIDHNVGGDPNAANGWLGIDDFEWASGGIVQDANRCFDNAGFELGDFTNWTQSDGATWGTAPGGSNGIIPAAENKMCATSLANVANGGAGKLTSVTFKMAKPGIGFALAGFVDGAAAYTCKVNLRLASDNSLVASASMPGTTHVWQRLVLNGWAAWGKQVYLEVIDTAPGTTSGDPWIGVDDFHFIEGAEVPVELSSFSVE